VRNARSHWFNGEHERRTEFLIDRARSGQERGGSWSSPKRQYVSVRPSFGDKRPGNPSSPLGLRGGSLSPLTLDPFEPDASRGARPVQGTLFRLNLGTRANPEVRSHESKSPEGSPPGGSGRLGTVASFPLWGEIVAVSSQTGDARALRAKSHHGVREAKGFSGNVRRRGDLRAQRWAEPGRRLFSASP
jgi:hypothetical protein